MTKSERMKAKWADPAWKVKTMESMRLKAENRRPWGELKAEREERKRRREIRRKQKEERQELRREREEMRERTREYIEKVRKRNGFACQKCGGPLKHGTGKLRTGEMIDGYGCPVCDAVKP